MSYEGHERRKRKRRYDVVISYVTAALIGIGSILYTNYTDNKSNAQFCDLFTLMDTAYQDTPPASPLGERLAEIIHNLRSNLKCEG